MGKYDDAMYSFLSDNGRFADLFNGAVFGGEEVLQADALEEGAERYAWTGMNQGQRTGETGNRRGQSRKPGGKFPNAQNCYRDIKKHLKEGARFSVVAIENQSDIDYTMPWRIMQYDGLEYERQIREIENGKRRVLSQDKENIGHWETRFGQGDKLHPVYTICLYHGTKRWDGPKSLEDMMDFGAGGKLREAMKALYKSEGFMNISTETARTIAIMTDNTQILKKLDEQEEEETNMCKAWDEIQQEWEEATVKAKEEGIRIFILDNIEEGKSEETIIEKLCRRFLLDAGTARAYYSTYSVNA
ncbi:MAG: Rpn family recombination-promoting nuclease/putative transposase [Acetatifactor sp.]|nr:Rpn family recombination-promoting nuclease/putative transposase [Acetatifactor sp.]